MPGFVPGIHVFSARLRCGWPGQVPAMTIFPDLFIVIARGTRIGALRRPGAGSAAKQSTRFCVALRMDRFAEFIIGPAKPGRWLSMMCGDVRFPHFHV
jgi:hypothetical protein